MLITQKLEYHENQQENTDNFLTFKFHDRSILQY